MGAFEGLRVLRRQATSSPSLQLRQLVELIRKIDPDARGLDFEASLELQDLVCACADHTRPHEFFRACIHTLVLTKKASWGRLVTRGRERFVRALERDAQQCFRAARLMESPPADDVVDWWDRLAGLIRSHNNENNLTRGRAAERLTITHEIERLSTLGITDMPKWVAIDDNTAGYDVLSRNPGPFGPVNLLIEVKSTIMSPLRFFLSRNEWESATKYGASYVFHVWDMAPVSPRLYVRTVEQIRPYIPIDQKKGRWATVEIPLGVQ